MSAPTWAFLAVSIGTHFFLQAHYPSSFLGNLFLAFLNGIIAYKIVFMSVVNQPTYDEDMSIDEVDEIVSFVKTQSKKRILYIGRDEEGYVVRTGFVSGPISGRGETFHLEKNNEGWSIKQKGSWVS